MSKETKECVFRFPGVEVRLEKTGEVTHYFINGKEVNYADCDVYPDTSGRKSLQDLSEVTIRIICPSNEIRLIMPFPIQR